MSKALIFDCDGVLADTEFHGHLMAFNLMWQKLGVNWQWSPEQYAEKVKIGGGKERMGSLFDEPHFQDVFDVPKGEAARKELLAKWHAEKTAIYQEIIASGAIPARGGVKRLAEEALARDWKLAVASTSAKPSVDAVLHHAVGPETARRFALVLAGDVVPKKKPAPDIYLMAVANLGIGPGSCVAIEDSRNGLLAAFSAGITTVVTTSYFTKGERFDEAVLVVDSLGDPDGERTTVLANRTSAAIGEYVRIQDLEEIVSSLQRGGTVSA
jgi:HAD superfamily hydrolase (TIGR01509 family)